MFGEAFASLQFDVLFEQKGFAMKMQRTTSASTAIAFLAVAAGLAMPMTTAQSQDATGTVTCNLTYQDATSAGPAGTTEVIETPITLLSLGGLFANRWGPGRDVTYGSSGMSGFSGEGDRNFSAYFFSTPYPNNSSAFEQEYSETGKLDFKISKANKFTITGTSFVSMDYSWTLADGYLHLVGQCTWKLNGTGVFF